MTADKDRDSDSGGEVDDDDDKVLDFKTNLTARSKSTGGAPPSAFAGAMKRAVAMVSGKRDGGGGGGGGGGGAAATSSSAVVSSPHDSDAGLNTSGELSEEWSPAARRSMVICGKIIDILLQLSQGEAFVKSNIGTEAIIKGVCYVLWGGFAVSHDVPW